MAEPNPGRAQVDVVTEGDDALTRTQRRLLRRIYNGRAVPIMVDDRPFLTYKEASRHLQSLAPEAREKAYVQMRDQAK